MSAFAALAENMRIGFDAALSLNNLWYCFLGVFLGTAVAELSQPLFAFKRGRRTFSRPAPVLHLES